MPGIAIGYGLPFFRSLGTPLSGIPFPGETLTASRAGQWTIDGTPIPGETGDTYTVGVRDIGEVLRCGNSRPVTIWHPRNVPQVVAAFDANRGISSAVGTEVPEWIDDVGGVSATQATSNLQPMLGYVEPPEGNTLAFSSPWEGWGKNLTNNNHPNYGWRISDGGEPEQMIGQGPDDPFGRPSIEIHTTGVSQYGNGITSRFNPVSAYVGKYFRVFAWVRSKSGVIPNSVFRFSVWGHTKAEEVGEEWKLIEYANSNEIITSTGISLLTTQGSGSWEFYVGSVWAVERSWSDEFVYTTGTPVIPDTTNLLRCVRFDGVNDYLDVLDLRDMYRNAAVWGVVAGAQCTAPTGSGKIAQAVFSTDFTNSDLQTGLYGRWWYENKFGMTARYNMGDADASVTTANNGDWTVLTGENDGVVGKVKLSVDGATPVETVWSTGTVQDVQLRAVRIGTWAGVNYNLTGNIAAVIPYVGAPTPLDMRRLQQYVGLLCGKNLGLSVT